jgi:hypothetical protein
MRTEPPHEHPVDVRSESRSDIIPIDSRRRRQVASSRGMRVLRAPRAERSGERTGTLAFDLLAKLHVLRRSEFSTMEERACAEADLARIMDSVRSEMRRRASEASEGR